MGLTSIDRRMVRQAERRALERKIVEGFQVGEYQVPGVMAPNRKIYNLLQIVTGLESCSIQVVEVVEVRCWKTVIRWKISNSLDTP